MDARLMRCNKCGGNMTRHKGELVAVMRCPVCGREVPAGDDFPARAKRLCDDLAEMLVAKNAAYGNSALEPVRVFSNADTAEQLRVRLDDKLSRIARGKAAGEDVLRDVAGYVLLLMLAEGITGKESPRSSTLQGPE